MTLGTWWLAIPIAIVILATFAYALFWWWIGPNPPATRRVTSKSDDGMGGVIPAVSTDSGSSSHDSSGGRGDGHGGGDGGGHAF